ncbi:MAG: RluA family pseudouridine synthase [Clostridia bacterium]|nr:RluA family pseudouridine synthase [Clostridia bacterium]
MHSFEAVESQYLKKLLSINYPFLNEIQIKSIFNQKDIKVNGKRVKENILINKNDNIEVYYDFEKFLSNLIEIVYQDDNILIINKPIGIETVSEDKNRLTLEQYLLTKFPFAKAVHRLDLNTKGLLMFALNADAENELLNAIRSHNIYKTYKTIVYTKNAIKNEKYIDYISSDKIRQTSKICAKNKGKIAILEILSCTKINNDLSLLDIKLYTGRMHQIRVQLANHKIYVLGDGKYGDKVINRKYKTNTQLLQATKLEFNFSSDSILHYLNEKKFEIDFKYNLNFNN